MGLWIAGTVTVGGLVVTLERYSSHFSGSGWDVGVWRLSRCDLKARGKSWWLSFDREFGGTCPHSCRGRLVVCGWGFEIYGPVV